MSFALNVKKCGLIVLACIGLSQPIVVRASVVTQRGEAQGKRGTLPIAIGVIGTSVYVTASVLLAAYGIQSSDARVIQPGILAVVYASLSVVELRQACKEWREVGEALTEAPQKPEVQSQKA